MAVLPTCPLGGYALRRCGKVTRDARLRTKNGRLAGEREIDAEFEILRDVSAGESGIADERPRQCPPWPPQLARHPKPVKTERANLVFYQPREFGNACLQSRTCRRQH